MAANTNTCVISGSSVTNVEETNRIHLMPCQIEHDGKARVGAYFDPSVRQENTQSAVLENDSDSKRKINILPGLYELCPSRQSSRYLWVRSFGMIRIWINVNDPRSRPSNLWNSQTLRFEKWVGKNLEIWVLNLEIYIKAPKRRKYCTTSTNSVQTA